MKFAGPVSTTKPAKGHLNEPENSAPVKPRGKPSSEGRFVWIASFAAERIVNEIGATDAAFAMAVYIALARLSSKEKNSPQIEATVQKIAGMARLSYPKTLAILDALETQAKVIAIKRHPRQKGQLKQMPHTYTLLSLRLNAVKSGRVNSIESGRLNGAGSLLFRDSERTPPKGGVDKKDHAPLDGSALGAQPSASDDPWAEVAP